MEDFINDEIDMILEEMNSDREDENLEPVELTEWQRGQIFEHLRDGYEHIWEDLYDALNDEISNYID